MDYSVSKQSARPSDSRASVEGGDSCAARTRGTAPLYIHKLLPIAILYFFFNSIGLPNGLLYTAILSPLFFLWLYLDGKRWLTTKFVVVLMPFIVMQLGHGVDSLFEYVKSIALLWTVYITVYTLCWALMRFKKVECLFDQLIVLNFWIAMIALVVLFTPAKSVFWNTDFRVLGEGGGWAPRLALLTSEPSAYGELMVPLLIFAVIRLFMRPSRYTMIHAVVIVAPIILVQSFGAISICATALGVALFFRFRHLIKQKYSLLVLGSSLALCIGLVLVPNPISRRLFHIAAGEDSSTQVRTVGAYIEAYTIVVSKSILWGVGPGQAKLFEATAFIKSLGFQFVVIPNATADTFAHMGLVGVLAKFILEVYFFFRMRVFKSVFRLAMFIAAFLYQFAGGNLMDVQGYLMWCFAFAPVFPELDTNEIKTVAV